MPDTSLRGSAARGDDARLQHGAKIRDLNDRARAALAFKFIYVTIGVRALAIEAPSAALNQVRTFDAFSADNDPYGEHDFGSMIVMGERMFWKIDYYDQRLAEGSPDPADERLTARVLTIMLASEY